MKTTLAILCLAILVIAAFPVARERMRRSQCINQLSGIGNSIQQYSLQHTNSLPRSFADLKPYMEGRSHIFHCPSSHHTIGTWEDLTAWCSYRLVAGPSQNSSTGIVAYCDPDNHGMKGCNVLFSDGSLMWLEFASFEPLLSQIRDTENTNNH